MDSSSILAHLKQVYNVSYKDCVKLIQLFEPLEVKKNEHLYPDFGCLPCLPPFDWCHPGGRMDHSAGWAFG
jgi:hypothetical protein